VKVALVNPDLPGQQAVLGKVPFRIGRDSDVEVWLDDPYVSHDHCTFYQIGNTLIVRDLGSKNGTYVNGQRITEACVKPGDRLTLGETSLRAIYHPREKKRHE
jgi:pSer/pThr/pTyr-binding forkhead associated (FHA) protein